MSGPLRGGVRALIGPEAIGALLAAVVLVGLATTGVLPALGGGGPGSSEPPPSASASAAPSVTGVDPTTRAALLAALAVNQRLTVQVEALQAAIDEEAPTGATIKPLLQSMSPDVTAGAAAAAPIARDPATAVLGGDLAAFYAEIDQRNEEAFDLSIQEGAALRAAAVDVVALLGQLPALDDRIADALEGRPTGSGSVPSAAVSPSPSASAEPSPSSSASAEPTSGESGEPSPSPLGPSLLVNGTFDTDLAGWALEVAADARASAAHDPAAGPDGSGAARIDITTGSAARVGITFVSSPFQLERGRRYRVTAYVRSTADREVRLRIATADGQTTTTARGFEVGASWTPLTFDLTDLSGGSASVFALDVGRGEEPVWLDRVTVVAIDG